MSRTSRWVAPTLLACGALSLFNGCESVRQGVARHPKDDPAVTKAGIAEDESTEGQADPHAPLDVKTGRRPFFSPSRLSGALSDEGREIERDLGIR